LAHAINNFLPVTLTYFFREQFDPADLETVGTGPGEWVWAIPALGLSIAALYYFYRNSLKDDDPKFPNLNQQITNKLQ